MTRSMLIWIAVLLVGVAIVTLFPILRGEVPPDEAGGFGAALVIPFGYFLCLIGAVGLVVAWIKARAV